MQHNLHHVSVCIQVFVTHIAPTAIILAAFYLVQCGIREVKFFSTVVYGQAVRGSDVSANDHKNIGTSQCGTHDTGRLLIPVGPEHEAVGESKITNVNRCNVLP